MLFLYNLWQDIRTEGRKATGAAAAAPRPRHRAAHPARPVDRQLQGHLDRQRRDVRKRACSSSSASSRRWSDASSCTRATAPIFDAFNVTAGARKGAAPEGLAEIRRLHRDQSDRSAGGHRRQHRQVRRQVESSGRHDRQDQHRGGEGNRAADPSARSGRHHRHRFHRHGRAQEPPEGDAGARRSHARRPRPLQNSPVQRFRPGGHHPQARQAEPGADAVRSVPGIARARATSRACRP